MGLFDLFKKKKQDEQQVNESSQQPVEQNTSQTTSVDNHAMEQDTPAEPAASETPVLVDEESATDSDIVDQESPATISSADSVGQVKTADDAVPDALSEIVSEQVADTEPATPSPTEPEQEPEKKKGFFSRFFTREKKETLDRGLEKTKQGLFAKIAHTVAGKSTIDDDVLDQLEEVFITSDVGVDTTLKILDRIQARVKKDKYVGTAELNDMLCDEITQLLADNNNADMDDFQVPEHQRPYVIMVVGVNGVGKTTTIGKLAHHFKQAGNKVVLGAADTYRAAADEQLEIWGQRVGVPVIKHAMGTDPASVAYDAVASAKAQNADVVIIDTAGRLHNNVGLMRELTKIKNVMQKVLPEAPHEVLLVIDGSTGQNAFEQAKQFVAATEVNALAVTKLDGTAKGGVVIGISDQFKIPVKYIGLGEGIDHLQIFRREEFVKSLFGK